MELGGSQSERFTNGIHVVLHSHRTITAGIACKRGIDDDRSVVTLIILGEVCFSEDAVGTIGSTTGEGDLIGPLLIVAGIVVPWVMPMLFGCSCDHKPSLLGVFGQLHLCPSLFVAIHFSILTGSIIEQGYKAISPARLADIDGTEAFSSSHPFEITSHSRAWFEALEFNDIHTVVLGAVAFIHLEGITLDLMQRCGESVLIGLTTLSDAVDIPSDGTAGIVEKHLIEIVLAKIVHALVSINHILGKLRCAPKISNELLAIKLAPVVLDEIVGIAPVLMHEVLVSAVDAFAIIAVGELLFGIDLESLPLGTAFPPSASSSTICTEAPSPSVIGSKVATDKILEGVANLMGDGVTTTGIECPRSAPEGTDGVVVA